MRDIFRFALTLSLCTALSACDRDDATSGLGGGGGRGGWTHVIGSGTTLYLASLGTDEVSNEGSVQLPDDGVTTYLNAHNVFAFAQHPTKPWLYVVSMNDCGITGGGGNGCVGNGRIDVFEIKRGGLEPRGTAYYYVPQSGLVPNCVYYNFGVPGQIGGCAPTSIAFTPDGQRAFVKERVDERIHTFNVNSDGTFEFVSAAGANNLHGLAVHPNSDYLYHGLNIYSIAGGSPPGFLANFGTGGNATQVLYEGTRLLTGYRTDYVTYSDITNPGSHNFRTFAFLGGNRVRDIAVNEAQTMAVAVGQNSVWPIAVSPGFLSPRSPQFDGRENRAVSFGADDTRFVVGWFLRGPARGGITLYGIDEAGDFGLIQDVPLAKPVIAIHRVRR